MTFQEVLLLLAKSQTTFVSTDVQRVRDIFDLPTGCRAAGSTWMNVSLVVLDASGALSLRELRASAVEEVVLVSCQDKAVVGRNVAPV